MITATHASASYNILSWLSIGAFVVAVITAVVAAFSYRGLKRATREPPEATLPQVLKHPRGRHNQPASRDQVA
jgi:hypothetical protein